MVVIIVSIVIIAIRGVIFQNSSTFFLFVMAVIIVSVVIIVTESVLFRKILQYFFVMIVSIVIIATRGVIFQKSPANFFICNGCDHFERCDYCHKMGHFSE